MTDSIPPCFGRASDTKHWRLGSNELFGVLSEGVLSQSWFMSIRKRFFAVRFIIRFLCSSLLQRVSLSVSITAFMPFRKLLDSKNGVAPGTMAIRKDTFPRGIKSARLLTNVW